MRIVGERAAAEPGRRRRARRRSPRSGRARSPERRASRSGRSAAARSGPRVRHPRAGSPRRSRERPGSASARRPFGSVSRPMPWTRAPDPTYRPARRSQFRSALRPVRGGKAASRSTAERQSARASPGLATAARPQRERRGTAGDACGSASLGHVARASPEVPGFRREQQPACAAVISCWGLVRPGLLDAGRG